MKAPARLHMWNVYPAFCVWRKRCLSPSYDSCSENILAPSSPIFPACLPPSPPPPPQKKSPDSEPPCPCTNIGGEAFLEPFMTCFPTGIPQCGVLKITRVEAGRRTYSEQGASRLLGSKGGPCGECPLSPSPCPNPPPKNFGMKVDALNTKNCGCHHHRRAHRHPHRCARARVRG